MKIRLIVSYIAIVLITILGTPILMVIGVVDGWKVLIHELKRWYKEYWRATDE